MKKWLCIPDIKLLAENLCPFMFQEGSAVILVVEDISLSAAADAAYDVNNNGVNIEFPFWD